MAPRSSSSSNAKKQSPARARGFVRGLDDTRALLVAAARDVFLEHGPGNFSLREVARRVGVSAAAVYRHFDGKEALLFAACTQGFQVFSGYLVRALAAATPRERMLAMSRQYRAFALENPLDYRFIFMSVETTAPLVHGAKVGACSSSALPQDTTFRFLVDRVKECVEAGVFAAGDPDDLALLIWAHVHGVVSLRISGHLGAMGDDRAFAQFFDASVERLLLGLSG